MREIKKIRLEKEFSNIQFISISIDEAVNIEVAKKWFASNRLNWLLYFDPKKELFYKILEITENTSTAIPLSIVVDKNGLIVSLHQGFELENYKEDLQNDLLLIKN